VIEDPLTLDLGPGFIVVRHASYFPDSRALTARSIPSPSEGLPEAALEELAKALARSLPCTGRVSVSVLGVLATGYPVSRQDLAARLAQGMRRDAGLDSEAFLNAAMERLPNLELDEDGRIVGCGLTLAPTDHQIIFSGPPLFTWCAFDTLLFPALLGRSAEVRSRCHATGVPIRCSIGVDGIEELAPAAAVITLVVPDGEGTHREAGGSFCRHAHFFASPAAAGRWRETHTGFVLPVAQAHVLARRISALRALVADEADQDLA
jgi:alkylmercury lyase